MKKIRSAILATVLLLLVAGQRAVIPCQAQGGVIVDPATRTVENDYIRISWDLSAGERVTGLYLKDYDPTYNLNGSHEWEWTGNAYYYHSTSSTTNLVSISNSATWDYDATNQSATVYLSSVRYGIPIFTQYTITADSPAILVRRTFGFGSAPIEAIRLAPYALLAYPRSYFTTFVYPRTDGTIAFTTATCESGCPKYDWDETWIDIEAPSWDVGLGLVNSPSNPSSYAWLDRYGYSSTSYVYGAIPGPTFDEDLTVSYVLYPHLGDYTAVDWDSVIPSIPVDITHLEVTQAIQDQTNTVPLIADKLTLVRVYLRCGTECTGEPVTGLLRGYGPSGELPGSPARPVNGPVEPRDEMWSSQRGSLEKSLNFVVPLSWTSGGITLIAEVGGTTLSEVVNFEETESVDIRYVTVRYRGKEPDSDRIASAAWFAKRVFPTADVNYTPGTTLKWNLCLRAEKSCPAWKQHRNLLSIRLALLYPFQDTFVMGWLPDGSLGTGSSQGYTICQDSILGGVRCQRGMVGDDSPTDGPWILAHESGHLLGQREALTVQSQTDKECFYQLSDMDPESEWPWEDTKIHDYGLDGYGDAWLDQLPSAVKRADETYDFMSYCGRLEDGSVWTSAHSSTSIHDRLAVGAQSISVRPTQEGQYLFSTGLVYTDTTATLEPTWLLALESPPSNPQVGTTYCLEAQDGSGMPLAGHCFDLSFTNFEPREPTNVASFAIVLPYNPAMTRIVLRVGDQVLGTQNVSATAPAVSVLSPNGGETWGITGTHTITWDGSDADGDPLAFMVFYSPDGTDWGPVGGIITDTQVIVDASELPGGSGARVRVMATDGINTSSDESDAAFDVGRKAPTAYILSPDASSDVRLGVSMLLHGYAYDLEDGVLADSALHWTSSLDGDLGMGSQLLVTLSQGKHVVTFTATDSDGSNSIAQVLISVGVHRIYLPVVTKAH